MSHVKTQKGISMIEVVVVIFVATVLLFSIAQVAALSFRISSEKKLETRAAYYANEGIEALKAIRDESWDARIAVLTTSSTYYLVPSMNSWTISATDPGALDGIFTRTAVMQGVTRDLNDDIATGGGTNDTDTKKFTVTISWNTQSGKHALATDAYIANLLKN